MCVCVCEKTAHSLIAIRCLLATCNIHIVSEVKQKFCLEIIILAYHLHLLTEDDEKNVSKGITVAEEREFPDKLVMFFIIKLLNCSMKRKLLNRVRWIRFCPAKMFKLSWYHLMKIF